jgi:hypothetical protein
MAISAEAQRFNLLQHFRDQNLNYMLPIYWKGSECIDWLETNSYYGMIEDGGELLSIYRKGRPMNWQMEEFKLSKFNLSESDFNVYYGVTDDD